MSLPQQPFVTDNPDHLDRIADWCALHGLDPRDVPQSAIRIGETDLEYRLFVRDEAGHKVLNEKREPWAMTEWRITPLLAPFPQPEEAL